MKNNNYPMYNDGLVARIDYQKLIKMQSQEPIITFEKTKINGQNTAKISVMKRNLRRTTKK